MTPRSPHPFSDLAETQRTTNLERFLGRSSVAQIGVMRSRTSDLEEESGGSVASRPAALRRWNTHDSIPRTEYEPPAVP